MKNPDPHFDRWVAFLVPPNPSPALRAEALAVVTEVVVRHLFPNKKGHHERPGPLRVNQECPWCGAKLRKDCGCVGFHRSLQDREFGEMTVHPDGPSEGWVWPPTR